MRERPSRPRVLYVQYTNPAAYPPIHHSGRMLADAGFDVRMVGTSRAKELILSGRQVPAEEALRIGLADRVVPHESLHDEAIAWGATFAKGPLAVQALAKHAIDRGLDGTLAAGLDLELEDFVAAFRTEDSSIGIKSFLAEGPGKAAFTGR